GDHGAGLTDAFETGHVLGDDLGELFVSPNPDDAYEIDIAGDRVDLGDPVDLGEFGGETGDTGRFDPQQHERVDHGETLPAVATGCFAAPPRALGVDRRRCRGVPAPETGAVVHLQEFLVGESQEVHTLGGPIERIGCIGEFIGCTGSSFEVD